MLSSESHYSRQIIHLLGTVRPRYQKGGSNTENKREEKKKPIARRTSLAHRSVDRKAGLEPASGNEIHMR